MNIVAQIAGAIALMVWVASIQTNSKRKILGLQIIANIFYALQYLFIGAIGTGVLSVVSVIRISVFYKNEKKKEENGLLSLLLLNLLILIVTVIFYQNVFSLLPMVIGMIYTYATWQKNTKVIRFCFLIAACIWLVYNFYVGAYVVLIGNLFEIISGAIAVTRFDILKREKT